MNWTFGYYHRNTDGTISEWHAPDDTPQSGITVNVTIIGIGDRNKFQTAVRTGWHDRKGWHIHGDSEHWQVIAWTEAPEPFRG